MLTVNDSVSPCFGGGGGGGGGGIKVVQHLGSRRVNWLKTTSEVM